MHERYVTQSHDQVEGLRNSMGEIEEQLKGGRVTPGVVKIGDSVRRPLKTGHEFRHALLAHIEKCGFAGAPSFLGIDKKGREMLSFIAGEVPGDLGHYEDDVVMAAGRLLRKYHDATSSFSAIAEAGCEVACHNDWAPVNSVFRDGLPIAMIDFDTVAPGMRLWDLGYSAFTWLDLGNPDYTGAEQIRRIELFSASYDHCNCRPSDIAVHAVARQALLATAARGKGDDKLARWASEACDWTSFHVLEQLLPTRQFGP